MNLDTCEVARLQKRRVTLEFDARLNPHVICFFLPRNFTALQLASSLNIINMTSKSFSQGAFLQPESSPDGSKKSQSLYRHPTVYDAVAGKI